MDFLLPNTVGDTSIAMHRTLNVLKMQGKCSLKKLCDVLGITYATGSVMIDKLVKSGLVKRSQSKVDRRKVVLTLTEKGQLLAEEDQNKQFKNLENAFIILSSDDIEILHNAIKTVDNILNKIPLFTDE
jgi:DNA-binding MarR family transcriptional regulator